MSSLSDIRVAIAQEGAILSGIQKVSEDAPPKIENAELPMLWAEIGPATYSYNSVEYLEETRTIKVIVAALGKTTGLNVKDKEYVEDLLETARLAFGGLKTIDVDNVLDLRMTNDTGVAIMEGYSRDFIGFEIDMQVTIINMLTITDRQ